MAENTSLPFSIGEAVVYPNQGLCNITGIEEKEVANQKLLFVQLVRQSDGAKVMVPTEKAIRIGLRKIATRDEVLTILEFLKSDSDKASLDWKTRARTNTEHMSRGSLMGLAEVVKALQVLSELRPLPTKERELYNNARGMLVEEMAAALEMEPCDAEDTIDVVLFPLGKVRPRRTVEEFQLGLEVSLETDFLPLEEEVLLEELEEGDSEEDNAEEDNPEEDELEEESLEALAQDSEEDEMDFVSFEKVSAAKEKAGKTGKKSPSKTSKHTSKKQASAKPPAATKSSAATKPSASAKPSATKKTRKEAATPNAKNAKNKTTGATGTAHKTSPRSSSSKKKAL